MSNRSSALRASSALVALAAMLTACVQAPMGPTVQALPGPRKSFTEFQQDNSYCMGFAQSSIGDAQKQLDQQQALTTVGGALLGAAVGAAIGGGRGAAYGAGTGLAAGAATGADAASYNASTMQQRYDNSFAQCMFAKGNTVPGVSPVYATYEPIRPSSDPLVRSIQNELVRTGYLRGGVDGNYGPMTRSAILAFEQANGMAEDPSPSGSLLARLRGAPGGGGAVASAGGLVQPVTGGARAGGQAVPPPSAPLISPVSAPVPAPAPAPGPSGLVAPVTGGGATATKGQ